VIVASPVIEKVPIEEVLDTPVTNTDVPTVPTLDVREVPEGFT